MKMEMKTKTKKAPKNANFFWTKYGGTWAIATSRTDISSPNNMDGVIVPVSKKSGLTTYHILGALLARYDTHLIWSNEGRTTRPTIPYMVITA